METNVNNSSTRLKNKSLDLVDGISALPDSILGFILSFLPTNEAVATAFLSKRWRFVWRNVHNLDFCHEDCVESFDSENENMKFVRFVDRVLLLHDVGLLYKFHLDWNHDHISSSHVHSWINTAVTRKIYEIHLFTELCDQPFKMPRSVFSCDSLRSLELYGICVPAVDVVCLPKLESLKLFSISFQSEEGFEKLISKCPMLNYMHLEIDIVYMGIFGISTDFAYIISSTSVKRLELSFDYESQSPEEDIGNSLMLKASSLEYLKLEGLITRISVPKSLSSLVEADFRIELVADEFPPEEICNSIVEAVDAFDRVKALTLSADATWALSCSTISLSSMFTRLVKLETKTYCCYHSSLKDLIQNSDNLEVLTIRQRPNYEDRSNHDDHVTWTAPVTVPRCLSNSLKKVAMDSYYDYENVGEMIRYMLKHGSALEVMQIYCSRHRPDIAKLAFVHEICKFPRKSPDCEVEISYTYR